MLLTRRCMIAGALAGGALAQSARAFGQSDPMAAFNELAARRGERSIAENRALFEASARAEDSFLRTLEASSVPDANAPWEMFLHELRQYVQGGNPRSVQMVTAARPADWTDPKYGPYRLSKALGDAVPKWGTVFDPTGGTSLGQRYGVFIENILLPVADADLQRRAAAARLEWQAALTTMRARSESVGDRWLAFDRRQQGVPVNRRLSYDAWYARFEGPALSALDDDVGLKAQTYSSLLTRASGGYAAIAEIIRSYSRLGATFQVTAEGADADRIELVHRYQINHSLDQFVRAARDQAPDRVKFTFNKQSFRKTSSETRWGGSASYGGFIRIGGGASGGSSYLDVVPVFTAGRNASFRARLLT